MPLTILRIGNSCKELHDDNMLKHTPLDSRSPPDSDVSPREVTANRNEEEADGMSAPCDLLRLPSPMLALILAGLDQVRDVHAFTSCCRQLHFLRNDVAVQAAWLLQHHHAELALLLALESPQPHLLTASLMRQGAASCVDSLDPHGRTALHRMCKRGDLATVAVLLQGGADINRPDAILRTPLMLASLAKQGRVVRKLLSAGCCIEAADAVGCTALHWACSMGHLEEVVVLLQAGAGVNVPDLAGSTPLMMASMEGYADVVSLLLDVGGAEVGLSDLQGDTALSLACMEGHLRVVELLLQSGAQVWGSDEGGMTPLLVASIQGHTKVVKALEAAIEAAVAAVTAEVEAAVEAAVAAEAPEAAVEAAEV